MYLYKHEKPPIRVVRTGEWSGLPRLSETRWRAAQTRGRVDQAGSTGINKAKMTTLETVSGSTESKVT